MFGQLEALADSFLAAGIDLNDAAMFTKLVGYTGQIERYCVLMKDIAFCEEKESRLDVMDYRVTDAKIPVRFRERNNLIVPYVEIGMKQCWPSVIKEIIIGPGPDPELRRINMKHFLDLQGVPNVPVNLSKCQYRQ